MNKNKEIFERIYETPGAVWTRKEPSEEIINVVEKIKNKNLRVIDIGCGEGFYSIYLSKKGFDVLGIDLSENAIKYAKENAEKAGVKTNFMQMDISNLDKLNKKFDFVLEWGVLHHIMPDKREKYVKNIAGLLNKSGKYLSVCFNEKSADFESPGEKYRISPLKTRLYYSSKNELTDLFKPYFDIIESKLITMTGKGKIKKHIGNYFFMEKK